MTAIVLPDTDWAARAACGQADVPAPDLCRDCDVRFICLEYALERRLRGGLWGGFDDIERDFLLERSDGHLGEALLTGYRLAQELEGIT